MDDIDYLKLAAKQAMAINDERSFWLGSVGIRRDGALVVARNGAVHSTSTDDYQVIPSAHAEGRVLRKLGKGGIIYVSRVSKKTKKLAMSRPCVYCQAGIHAMQVRKVIYSVNSYQFGIWNVENDTDKIYTENCEINI